MLRECKGKGENWRWQRWGVLCANWNGEARVQGYNTCARGGGWYRKLDRQDVRGLSKTNGIRLAKLNIRSGRAGGLEAGLRVMKQGNVDVGVLQETNLTDGIHAHQGEGYAVWETISGDQALGGSSGSLEGGSGLAGGGHRQLWPKSGKLLADVGVAETVRLRGVRAPK